jgi:hypothetical protein
MNPLHAVSQLAEGSDRRSHADRRARPTPLWAVLRPGGRRRGFRRREEERNQYQDQPSGRIVLLVLLVVVFSALDALLTLLHIERGGFEVNPVMRWALETGMGTFVATKTVGTSVGAIFLAIHQNFPLSRVALHVVAVVYGAILGYHGILVALAAST